MMCIVCRRPIGPREGVAHSPTLTVHSKCEGRLPPDALRALTEDILAGLQVLNVRDRLDIPDELLAERAHNVAMGLWGNYRIEMYEDVTQEMPVPAEARR